MLFATPLGIGILGVSLSTAAGRITEDDAMTVENIAQLQHLLAKYSKYKHQLQAEDDEIVPKKKRQHGKNGHNRHRKVGQATRKRQEEAAESHEKPSVASDVSEDSGDSMYASLTNALYGWYYGTDGTTASADSKIHRFENNLDKIQDEDLPHLPNALLEEDVHEHCSTCGSPKCRKHAECDAHAASKSIPDVEENTNKMTAAEAEHMKRIHQYVQKNGHRFENNVDKIKHKDLPHLFNALHDKGVRQHCSSCGSAECHEYAECLHTRESSGLSPTQKGIFAGIITAGILLVLAAVAIFFIKKYGFPNSFVRNTRSSSGKRGHAREAPLRPPGPNVKHLYPSP